MTEKLDDLPLSVAIAVDTAQAGGGRVTAETIKDAILVDKGIITTDEAIEKLKDRTLNKSDEPTCEVCADEGRWSHPMRIDGYEYCRACTKGKELYKNSAQFDKEK